MRFYAIKTLLVDLKIVRLPGPLFLDYYVHPQVAPWKHGYVELAAQTIVCAVLDEIEVVSSCWYKVFKNK